MISEKIIPIFPMSMLMLKQSIQQTMDHNNIRNYKGQQFKYINLLGKIKQIKEKQKIITINDQTGQLLLQAKLYKQSIVYEIGKYFDVLVNLRRVHNGVDIEIIKINKIREANEIVLHMINVMQAASNKILKVDQKRQKEQKSKTIMKAENVLKWLKQKKKISFTLIQILNEFEGLKVEQVKQIIKELQDMQQICNLGDVYELLKME